MDVRSALIAMVASSRDGRLPRVSRGSAQALLSFGFLREEVDEGEGELHLTDTGCDLVGDALHLVSNHAVILVEPEDVGELVHVIEPRLRGVSPAVERLLDALKSKGQS